MRPCEPVLCGGASCLSLLPLPGTVKSNIAEPVYIRSELAESQGRYHQIRHYFKYYLNKNAVTTEPISAPAASPAPTSVA